MSELFERDRGEEREEFRKEFYHHQQELTRIQAKKSRTRMITTIVLGALILILGGGTISSYNSLVVRHEAVRKGWSQVENVMQRRADLIPNLVNTVKGVTQQELEVFSRIAEARSRLLSPSASPQERVRANEEIAAALPELRTQVLVLAERYPELRSNETFNRLMDELAGTENRIAVERGRYIQAVEQYNVNTAQFPTVIVARLFGFEKEENYFQVAEGARQAPEVKF